MHLLLWPRQPTAHDFCTARRRRRYHMMLNGQNMRETSRATAKMVLICVLLLGMWRPLDAMSTDTRPGRPMLTGAAAKNSRADDPRIRSSRVTPPRRTSKQARRSARRSVSQMQRRSQPAWAPRVLDPSRIQTLDGETFQYGRERFLVRGIEAMQMSDGSAARQRLDDVLHQGPITVVPMQTDLYGRIVAEVLVNNHNVSDLLYSP